MNGHFEIDESAYPIGYLRVGDGYKVTDMRNLHGLHSHPIPLASAKRIAANVNKKAREGAKFLQDGQELSLIGAVAVELNEREYTL